MEPAREPNRAMVCWAMSLGRRHRPATSQPTGGFQRDCRAELACGMMADYSGLNHSSVNNSRQLSIQGDKISAPIATPPHSLKDNGPLGDFLGEQLAVRTATAWFSRTVSDTNGV